MDVRLLATPWAAAYQAPLPMGVSRQGYWSGVPLASPQASLPITNSQSNEYSGLISLRMDWLDLLAVQRTLKSLLQHHSSKASTLPCTTSPLVQLSHPQKTPISWSALNKNPMPAHHFKGNPVDESTSRRGTDTPVHCLEKTAQEGCQGPFRPSGRNRGLPL